MNSILLSVFTIPVTYLVIKYISFKFNKAEVWQKGYNRGILHARAVNIEFETYLTEHQYELIARFHKNVDYEEVLGLTVHTKMDV